MTAGHVFSGQAIYIFEIALEAVGKIVRSDFQATSPDFRHERSRFPFEGSHQRIDTLV